jgi:hypothetical protein
MLTVSTFVAMALLYALFAKLVPIILDLGAQSRSARAAGGFHGAGRGRGPQSVEDPAVRRGRTMTGVYALFADPASAQSAVNRLRQDGASADDITVISSEPYEEYEFSHRDRPTWIHWLASLGGAIGLVVGYALTSGTERAWPIQTGGMPIVSTWPNLIVMFELTMLGAVVATVVTLLVTAQLPGRRPPLYDPEVSDGLILVGIADPRDTELERLEQALASAGGRVKTVAHRADRT